MDVVVDTSIVLAVLTSEPERARIIDLTKDADLIAPASVHWEIGNALSAMLKRKRLTLEQATEVIHAYAKIPIRFLEVSLLDALRIAGANNLYAYDAYVVSCAQSQHCSLISLDRSLIQAARDTGVPVIEVTDQ